MRWIFNVRMPIVECHQRTMSASNDKLWTAIWQYVHLLGWRHTSAASHPGFCCLYAFVKESVFQNFVREVLIWWVTSLLFLSTSQRQLSDQPQFRGILDRISFNKATRNDHLMSMTRRAALIPNFENSWKDDLRLFPTNKKVDEYNLLRLKFLNVPVAKIGLGWKCPAAQTRRLKQHKVWNQSYDCVLELELCWELIFGRRRTC